MVTKPRAKKRGRNHYSPLIRTLSWEWIKSKHPKTAERIKAVACEECGLQPPKPKGQHAKLAALLKKV